MDGRITAKRFGVNTLKRIISIQQENGQCSLNLNETHWLENRAIKMADLDKAPYNRIYEGVLGNSENDVFALLKSLELPDPISTIEGRSD